MNRAQLLLGSNVDTRLLNIERAVDILSTEFHISKISALVEGNDINGGPSIYANRIVEIETDLDVAQLHNRLKQIEAAFGKRTPIFTTENRTTVYINIPIDIDLVIFESQILKQDEINRPYYRTILAQGF